MKNLKPFNDFPLNESSDIGLQKIAQALDDIAIRLNGGSPESISLSALISRISFLLRNDPRELDLVFRNVSSLHDELGKVSHRSYGLTDDNVLPGFDAAGFKAFIKMFEVLMDNPNGVSSLFGVSPAVVRSLGLLLYYIYVSIFERPLFLKIQGFFGINK